ncbi:MAG: diguanylate cyclase [Candidatus Nanopelagicales bacterium]
MLPQSDQQLTAVIAQFDQAIYNHEQWHKNLIRTMVARLPPDPADLHPDAHHRCRFGQWYDTEAAGLIGEHPAFVALSVAHERMHESATELLLRVADDLPVAAADLDQFDNRLDRMRLELQSLRREFVELVENRDPLTGARNRAGLLPFLREQQALARRAVQSCVLVMIDIDHFKQVNDRHGHLVGDHVLASVAQRLRSLTRSNDRLYRFGGEEFLLCMPQTDMDAGLTLAERLRSAVADTPVDGGPDAQIGVTVSLGVTELAGSLTVEQSIDHADQALYGAKRAGRDRVEAWIPAESTSDDPG